MTFPCACLTSASVWGADASSAVWHCWWERPEQKPMQNQQEGLWLVFALTLIPPFWDFLAFCLLQFSLLFAQSSPQNPWKRKQNASKKQGKSQKQKSKKIRKSKERGIRASVPKPHEHCDCDCEFPPQAGNRSDFRHIWTKKHYDLKVRISIASDCDLIAQIPTENRSFCRISLRFDPFEGKSLWSRFAILVGSVSAAFCFVVGVTLTLFFMRQKRSKICILFLQTFADFCWFSPVLGITAFLDAQIFESFAETRLSLSLFLLIPPQNPKSKEMRVNPGRTRRGSCSCKGVFLPSTFLLESPFLEPLLRTLLRTLSPSQTHCKTPSESGF